MLDDAKAVRTQYRTAERLQTRINIHSRYSVNRQGFGNWILSQYRFQPGLSVLELGCGTGEIWKGQADLIRICKRLVLSDASEGMLRQARENLKEIPQIEFQQIDIQDIPFPDASFDGVIANMMLYHVPELQKGLREAARVLKEDGTFYCATYGEHGMMADICRMFRDDLIEDRTNHRFTLQNGAKQLKACFGDVQMVQYEDELAVTNVEDMVDYIFSLTGISDLQKLPRDRIREVLKANMTDGILRIPKEYGLFISKGPKRGTPSDGQAS